MREDVSSDVCVCTCVYGTMFDFCVCDYIKLHKPVQIHMYTYSTLSVGMRLHNLHKSICMYIFMRLYVYVHAHTYTYAHVRVCHTYTYLHNVCRFVCKHPHNTHTQTHTYTLCMHIDVSETTLVCMCALM